MSVAHVTTKGHEAWSLLIPEAMLLSLSSAATEGHVWLHGLTAGRGYVDV